MHRLEEKLNLSVSEKRKLKKIQMDAGRNYRAVLIQAMHRLGWTNVAIAKEMGISESTVRTFLK